MSRLQHRFGQALDGSNHSSFSTATRSYDDDDEDDDEAFDFEGFVVSDSIPEPGVNDVKFAASKHTGTKEWRRVIRMFSDNKSEYPAWDDSIFDLILQQLTAQHVTRFFVSLDDYGRVTNIHDGKWYLAPRSEVLKRTKQRFRDDRRERTLLCPETRASLSSVSSSERTSFTQPDPFVDHLTFIHQSLEQLCASRENLENDLRMNPYPLDGNLDLLREVDAKLVLLHSSVRQQILRLDEIKFQEHIRALQDGDTIHDSLGNYLENTSTSMATDDTNQMVSHDEERLNDSNDNNFEMDVSHMPSSSISPLPWNPFGFDQSRSVPCVPPVCASPQNMKDIVQQPRLTRSQTENEARDKTRFPTRRIATSSNNNNDSTGKPTTNESCTNKAIEDRSIPSAKSNDSISQSSRLSSISSSAIKSFADSPCDDNVYNATKNNKSIACKENAVPGNLVQGNATPRQPSNNFHQPQPDSKKMSQHHHDSKPQGVPTPPRQLVTKSAEAGNKSLSTSAKADSMSSSYSADAKSEGNSLPKSSIEADRSLSSSAKIVDADGNRSLSRLAKIVDADGKSVSKSGRAAYKSLSSSAKIIEADGATMPQSGKVAEKTLSGSARFVEADGNSVPKSSKANVIGSVPESQEATNKSLSSATQIVQISLTFSSEARVKPLSNAVQADGKSWSHMTLLDLFLKKLEMKTTSESEYDIIARSLSLTTDERWKAFFSSLSVEDFGCIVAHVTVDFDRPPVAELLAKHITQFTCKHMEQAIRKTSFHLSMAQRLFPFCVDATSKFNETIRNNLDDREVHQLSDLLAQKLHT